MRELDEYQTTGNSTVFRRLRKLQAAHSEKKCSFCKWHGGENEGRRPKHGEDKPRGKNKRRVAQHAND